MKQPKFRELRFESEQKLKEWLKEATFKIIHLKDFGQDMLTMYVHKTGEILHCDFHSQIYAGKFINMKKLAAGNMVEIWDNDANEYFSYSKLIIEDFSSCY